MINIDNKAIFAACLMSSSGAIIYLISPVLIGSAMAHLDLSSDQAGLLIASYFSGYTLVTLTAILWLHRCNLQITAWVSTLVFSASLITGATSVSPTVAMLTLLIGGAGAGLLYGISIMIISQSSDPGRYFGFALAAQLVLGSPLLFAGPAYIGPQWGYSGVLLATAGFVGLMSAATHWAPKTLVAAQTNTAPAQPKGNSALVFMAIAAVMIWFIGYSGIYAFIERIGAAGGMTGYEIGLVLSLTITTGLAGALGAAWMGNRYGNIKPHLIGAVGTTITVLLLLNQPGLVRYALAIIALTLSMNFWLAYMLSSVAAADVSGRYAVLVTAALGIGATLGPAIAGGIIQSANYSPMLAAGLLSILLGTGLIIRALQRLHLEPLS
jgi:predicted MFS family arabinose efflux permease